MSNGQIRPLEFGELLDRSFTLYRGHFALLFMIAVIPGLLLSPLQIFLKQPSPTVSAGDISGMIPFLIGTYVWLMVYSVATFYAHAAVVYGASEIYLGREVTVGAAYRRIGKDWLELIGISISYGLRIMLTAITIIGLIFVPLFFIWWAFVVQVRLFEGLSTNAVFKRSRELTLGNRGKVFMTYVLMFLLIWIVTLVLNAPVLFLQFSLVHKGQLPPQWLTLLSAMLNAVGTAVATPPLLVAMTMLYYNTRMVREGFDLQVLLDRLPSAAGQNPGENPDASPSVRPDASPDVRPDASPEPSPGLSG